MANPDQGFYGSNMGDMGNMGISGSYGAGMFGSAPWLLSAPSMYQAYPGHAGYAGYQGNQGRGQQAGGQGSGARRQPSITQANLAGLSPQFAGMYPQGYAGSSQFWQGMPNPYQPAGVTQQSQQANWPPAAPGMYPQGFGGSAPFWRHQRQQAQPSHQAAGPHTGHGPRGYQRSDERIKEDVHDRLTSHGQLDARGITVHVNNGEVTLSGTVDSRQAKHSAEDVAESVPGVKDVHNQLTVRQRQGQAGGQPRQGWERFEGMSAPHGLHPTQQAEQRAWQAGSLH